MHVHLFGKPPLYWLALSIYLLIGVLYIINNPEFESPDELSHFLYIHNLLKTGELPVLEDRATVFASGSVQRHHPPLYYLVGAVAISGTTRDDLPAYSVPNPYGVSGTIRLNNLNVMLHPLHPTGDTALAVAVLRMYSLLLGAGTLMLVYETASRAFASKTIAALAAALTALIPMFGYIHASITNDALVTFLYSAGICWMVSVWQTRRLGWREGIVLGCILAGILLTKLNGATLIGLVGMWVGIGTLTRRWSLSAALRTGLLAMAFILVFAGWWYVRNLQLYGDLLAWDATQRIWGRGPVPAGAAALSEAKGVWESFWLILGYFSIRGPSAIYPILTLFAGVGFVGAILLFIRQPRHRVMLLLLSSAMLTVIAGLIIATRSVNVSQGRILFPMLAGFAALVMSGWWLLLRRWAWLPLIPLLVLALYAPIVMLPAAYPSPRTVAALPPDVLPVDARAESLALLGYQLDRDSMTPDDFFTLKLYVQGTHVENPLLLIRVIDPLTNVPVESVDTYAGMVYPAELDPELIYQFEIALPIDRTRLTGTTPRRLDLLIGWRVPEGDFSQGTGTLLPWTLSDGTASGDMLRLPGLTLMDPDYRLAEPDQRTNVQFGDAITLVGYGVDPQSVTPGETVDVTLYWRSTGLMQQDWTATVALVNEQNQIAVQIDGPIPGYPTSAWRANGDTTETRRLVIPADLPAGTYSLVVGWYDPAAPGERLPASGSDSIQNDLFYIPVMQVP